jgi:hypothetical protein
VTGARTIVNPNAPAQPWLTTWLVIKDPVDFGDLSKFTLSLPGAVMCARPSQAAAGAPDGYASMSFTTAGEPGAHPRHQAFVLAAGKWLKDQKVPYSWRTGDGPWREAGGTAR